MESSNLDRTLKQMRNERPGHFDINRETHISTLGKPAKTGVRFVQTHIIIPAQTTDLILHPLLSKPHYTSPQPEIGRQQTVIAETTVKSETDLWIVNRLLEEREYVPWTDRRVCPDIDMTNKMYDRWRRIVSEKPRTMSRYDDVGETNAGLDNLDDEQLALTALEHDKSFRDDYGLVGFDDEAGTFLTNMTLMWRNQRRNKVKEHEPRIIPCLKGQPYKQKMKDITSGEREPNEYGEGNDFSPMSQTQPGRPFIQRRLIQRLLLTDTQCGIDQWFDASGITIGRGAATLEQRNKAKRLAYIWRDCFVTKLEDIGVTDLVQHSIVF